MEVKKTRKADLENKKNIFFEIGLTIAVAAVFVAFEWKTPVQETSDFITVNFDPGDEIMIPITQITRMQPPPPPPPAMRPTDLIHIVEEEDPLLEELDIQNINTDQNTHGTNPINIENLNYGPDVDADEDAILPFVPLEDMPYFPNVQQWITKHIKYPAVASELGIYGKVYIQFVVEKDGSVSNVKVARGVDASLDKEAVRVIESMPKWKPGKQRNKPVRVAYTMPIFFKLNE